MHCKHGSLIRQRWGFLLADCSPAGWSSKLGPSGDHWIPPEGECSPALVYSQVERCWGQLSITPQPESPTVGGSVLLSVDYRGKILIINWYRGSAIEDNRNILTHSPGSSYPVTHGLMYTGRETVLDNGSLQISNLLTNYSGAYTLQLSTTGYPLMKTTEITVYPASETTVPSAAQPGFRNSVGAVAGIAVGAIVGISLIVAVVIILFKKCHKTSRKPTYEPEKPATAEHSSPGDYIQPDVRRLPSIPPLKFPADYENDNHNTEEQPYTELAYDYLSTYKNLRSTDE
ncbi:hypothetical protein FKM82_001397 [Ascaphus truei]|uniref:uncharacterized protein LOC142471808 isoform X2 n=1 Tax=Ascaphus truei TaxID=8439 RepID=UPI003F5A614C